MSTSAPSQPQSSSLLGDYFAFLRHPTYDPTPGPPKQILNKIWRLYTGHILLIVLMAIGIQFVSQWIISIEDNKLGNLLESTPAYQFLLLAVVFAPLTEEIMFRLPLCFSRPNIVIPIALILFPVSTHFIQGLENQWLQLLIVWGGTGAVIYAIWAFFLGRISQRRGEQFFARHLTLWVYGSSIVFGLLHIMNYPKQAWIAAPILVLPQVTLGLLLAYVRIKFGFRWSVFTHGLHNFLASSPILFMAMGSSQFRQQFLDKSTTVELLPQDYVLQGVFLLWVIGISILVITSAVRLIREWKQANPQGQAL